MASRTNLQGVVLADKIPARSQGDQRDDQHLPRHEMVPLGSKWGCHCWLVQQCRENRSASPARHCWTSQQWHTAQRPLIFFVCRSIPGPAFPRPFCPRGETREGGGVNSCGFCRMDGICGPRAGEDSHCLPAPPSSILKGMPPVSVSRCENRRRSPSPGEERKGHETSRSSASCRAGRRRLPGDDRFARGRRGLSTGQRRSNRGRVAQSRRAEAGEVHHRRAWRKDHSRGQPREGGRRPAAGGGGVREDSSAVSRHAQGPVGPGQVVRGASSFPSSARRT